MVDVLKKVVSVETRTHTVNRGMTDDTARGL